MELLDTHQLLADGWSPQGIRREVAAGTLTRVRRGMYLLDPAEDQTERHLADLQATARTLSGEWWFSHASAGVLHGLPVPRRDLALVQVTRDRRTGASRAGNLKQWSCPVAEGDRALLEGLPVTTIDRTVVDLARTGDAPWSVAAADHALHAGLTSLDSLLAVVDQSPRRRGNRVARERLALANGLSESPGESISRVNMALAGLPMPELQHEFTLRGGSRVRGDFWWPEFRLVGEFDGLLKYAGDAPGAPARPDALIGEKAREDGLRELGLFVVRWGWRVALSRQLLAATIRGAITTATAAA